MFFFRPINWLEELILIKKKEAQLVGFNPAALSLYVVLSMKFPIHRMQMIVSLIAIFIYGEKAINEKLGLLLKAEFAKLFQN